MSDRCSAHDETQPGAVCQDDEGHGGDHTPQPGFDTWHNESYVPPATRQAQTDISGMADRTRQSLADPARPVEGKVGHDHPDTAHEAAAEVRYAVGSQKQRLVEALAQVGFVGLTNAEAAVHLGLSRNQTATRMGELHEDGWAEVPINPEGEPVIRATDPEGRYHGEVHVLTTAGREALGMRAWHEP